MPTVIMPPPVILQNNKQCIIQNEKTYCEEKDISEKELGGLFFILAFVVIYSAALFKVADWNGYVAFWGMIVFPLVALGFICFL